MDQKRLVNFIMKTTELLHCGHYYRDRNSAHDRARNIGAALHMDLSAPPVRLGWYDVYEMLSPTSVLVGIPDVLTRCQVSREIFAIWIAESSSEDNMNTVSMFLSRLNVDPHTARGWLVDHGYMI
jgi:hypothetical protein